MAIQRGSGAADAGGGEPIAPLVEHHEQRRLGAVRRLGLGTLACPRCDAPVALAGAHAPAEPLDCPYCGHAAAVRDFLSLGEPTRPARVEVRVTMPAAVDTLEVMAYVTSEARQHLLDTVAEASDELNAALAALGAAYEALDDASADRLEAALFRPVQTAYGRAQRTHTEFAERHGLPTRASAAPASAGLPSQGPRGFLDRATEAVAEADLILSELQDSMMPVEVGDPELRAGLAEVREIVGDVQARADDFLRTLGR